MEFKDYIDAGLSVVLSGIVIYVIVKVVKAAPSISEKLMEMWEKTIVALDQMNEISKENTAVMRDTIENREGVCGAVTDLATKIARLEVIVKENQDTNLREVEWAKEQMRILKDLYHAQTGKEWQSHIQKNEDGTLCIREEGNE